MVVRYNKWVVIYNTWVVKYNKWVVRYNKCKRTSKNVRGHFFFLEFLFLFILFRRMVISF
jgi:hypothetical protein